MDVTPEFGMTILGPLNHIHTRTRYPGPINSDRDRGCSFDALSCF
jgi:hypothetical protein